MDVNKLDFGNIYDLKRILKMPKTEMKYISPSEFKEIIKDVKEIITIHLYPFSYSNRKERCLLDMQRWSYHQIYLFVYQNQILWTFGHGDTSQARENHNCLLDLFLKDKEARKKVITAVLCVWNREIVSYYFYPGFAYSNYDIGSNWSGDIIKELKKSKIPYSTHRSDTLFSIRTLYFVDGKREVEIYHQLREDLRDRKFQLMIEKMRRENTDVVL